LVTSSSFSFFASASAFDAASSFAKFAALRFAASASFFFASDAAGPASASMRKFVATSDLCRVVRPLQSGDCLVARKAHLDQLLNLLPGCFDRTRHYGCGSTSGTKAAASAATRQRRRLVCRGEGKAVD